MLYTIVILVRVPGTTVVRYVVPYRYRTGISTSVRYVPYIVTRIGTTEARQAMGRIPKSGFSLDSVKVKVQKPSTGMSGTCGPEAIMFLSCLERSNGDEAECRAARDALARCMSASSSIRGRQHKPPINHHLQKVHQSSIPLRLVKLLLF